MQVSQKLYRNVMIAVGIAAVLLLPFWPYSRWGFLPCMVALFVVGMMIAVQVLQRE
jgi:hypothetical protein